MTAELLKVLLAALVAIASTTAGQLQQVEQAIAMIEGALASASEPPAIMVPAGGNLQAAIDAAMPGATIKLAPGASYPGPVVLRKRPTDGDKIITITVDGLLPDRRVTPADALLLARITSPDTRSPIRTEAGASHYALVGIDAAAVHKGFASISIGTNEETAAEQFPAHILLDRVLIAAGESETQRRGILLNGRHVTVTRSHISGIKDVGVDTQAILCNGPGPYHIEDNFLDAAGENFMCGGSASRVVGMVPSDITFRGNHVYKPLTLRGTGINGLKWNVKNLLELKNARRVLIEGNLFENLWGGQGQAGCAVLFTPRSHSDAASWTVVEDVTFQGNIVKNVSCALSILGSDNLNVSQTTARIRIAHNVIRDYGTSWGSGAYALKIDSGPAAALNIVVDHNTLVSSGGTGILLVSGKPMPGFVFTNNVAKHDTYGIFGSGQGSGNPAIAFYLPGAVIAKNVFAGGVARNYPAGNLFPSVTDFLAHFADPPTADYRLIAGTDWAAAGTDGTDLGASIPISQER